jgi:hypothetical protein
MHPQQQQVRHNHNHNSQQPQQQLSCSSFSVDDNSTATTGPIIVNPLISPCDDDRGDGDRRYSRGPDGRVFIGLTDDCVDDEDDCNDQVVVDGEDGNDGIEVEEEYDQSGSSVPSPVNESAFNPSSGLFSHHDHQQQLQLMSSSSVSSSSKPNVIFNGSSLVNACNDYETRMKLVNSLLRCKPSRGTTAGSNVRSSSHHRAPNTAATTTDRRRGNLISNPWETSDHHTALDFESINPRYGSRTQDHQQQRMMSNNTAAGLLSKHLLQPHQRNVSSHSSSSNSMSMSGNSDHVYECIDADSVNNFQISDYHHVLQSHGQQTQQQQQRHRSLVPSDPRILNV